MILAMVLSLSIWRGDRGKLYFVVSRILISIAMCALGTNALARCDVHTEHVNHGCKNKQISFCRTQQRLKPKNLLPSKCVPSVMDLRGGSDLGEDVVDLFGDGGVLKQIFRKVISTLFLQILQINA